MCAQSVESSARRRLQIYEPSEATEATIEQAAEALAVKMEGDASDCVSQFAPVTGRGNETAAMRANQQKLLDSMEHFPLLGVFTSLSMFVVMAVDAPSRQDYCTPCASGFDWGYSNVGGYNGDDYVCMCYDGSGCPRAPPGIECLDPESSGGCREYVDCPPAPPPPPLPPAVTNAVTNLLESGALMNPCARAHHLSR